MKFYLRIFAIWLLLFCNPAGAVLFSGTASSGGGGGAVAFTALHTYFLAATGCNDSNNGTSSSTPWCTMNHATVCGDVIEAASGTYNGDFSIWVAPTGCPSTSGGIDGLGGIYTSILVCAGNLQTCNINCATAACNGGVAGSGGRTAASACMNVNASNWAVEGFACNGNGVNLHRGFQVDACKTTSTLLAYIAFINDIAYNAADAFDANECGYNTTVPGNGIDEWAVLGSIAQNANTDSICLAAVDDVAAANQNALSGVHKIFRGIFSYNNSPVNTACTVSDKEGMMMDTFDAHGYASSVDISDNMIWANSWVGLQIFQQSFNSSSATFNIHNNTFYGNMVCPGFNVGDSGEINLQINGNFPWTINTYSNIALTNRSTLLTNSACTTTGSGKPYAMLSSAGAAVTVTTGGSGTLTNVFLGSATTCSATCDSTKSVEAFNSSGIGTNTYTNPTFVNTTDLLANWVGAPSCASFTNVPGCFGWNYSAQTATVLMPISDLTATAGAATGIGYRPPGACASDSLYPTWLKGINYLQVIGGNLFEVPGLTNKPCSV